jgi:hypothetical protein
MGMKLRATEVKPRLSPIGMMEWVVWFEMINGPVSMTPFHFEYDIADAIEKMRPLRQNIDYHIRFRGGIAFVREEDAIMIYMKFV